MATPRRERIAPPWITVFGKCRGTRYAIKQNLCYWPTLFYICIPILNEACISFPCACDNSPFRNVGRPHGNYIPAALALSHLYTQTRTVDAISLIKPNGMKYLIRYCGFLLTAVRGFTEQKR
jgi:hypothetical protein